MVTIIGVRFKKVGKIYYFDPRDLTVKVGQHVIVETARGIECGVCATANTQVENSRVVGQLKPIIRIATDTDLQVARGNEQQAKEAFAVARRKIEEHKLDMRLVTVECTFDLNKILFYFTSEGRVDFRDLVKDLASVFRTRIELRQIGVRDEAKMIGGLGICGRELCCASYMEDFAPVSINMAKEQNLSLNPAKISGTCGRLMCCLKYEHEAYVDLQKNTPKNDSLVQTPDGIGVVMSSQMLRSLLRVRLEDDPENPRVYHCDDVEVLRNGRAKKNGNQPAPAPQGRGKSAPRAEIKTEKRGGCGGCDSGCGGGACPKKAASVPEIDPLLVHDPVAVGMPEKPTKTDRPERGEKPARRDRRDTRGADKNKAVKSENAPAPKRERPQNEAPRMVAPAPAKTESAPAPKRERPQNEAPRMVAPAPAKTESAPAPKREQPKNEEKPRLVRSAPPKESKEPARQLKHEQASQQPRRVMAAPKTAQILADNGVPSESTNRGFTKPRRGNADASQVSITPAQTIQLDKPKSQPRPIRDMSQPESTPAVQTEGSEEVKKRRRRRGGVNRNKKRNEDGATASNNAE